MEWKEVTLGEVSSKIGDGLHGTPKYDDEGSYYFINGNNLNCGKIIIKDDTKRVGIEEFVKNQKELNEQTILVSINGTIGNVAKYNNEPCILGKSACYINVIKEVDKEFIYYVLTSANFKRNIINEATGTTIKNVSLKQMREYKFNIPCNISDQCRIASILSSLDRKIELNNKINADLEEMAQAIFKNWFVDFEPFKDGKFVDSELGMIPEGWKVGTLKDLLYLRKDSIKAANKGNLPYLPIDTIPMHCLVATDFKSNDEAKSSLQTFEQNDIVVGAMRVYFHKVILAPCKGITRTTCFVLSVKNENALAYSLMQCNQDEAISFAEKTSKGSTMPYAVWDGGYGEYKVVIPPSEVMKSFNDLLSNFFSKMNKNAIENSRLSTLRDTLLPRLMSGELEVPE